MSKYIKNQQFVVLLIAVLLVAVIVGISIATRVLATQFDETYKKLKIFDEVLYLIQMN